MHFYGLLEHHHKQLNIDSLCYCHTHTRMHAHTHTCMRACTNTCMCVHSVHEHKFFKRCSMPSCLHPPQSILAVHYITCRYEDCVYEDLRIKIKTFPLVTVALLLCYSLCVPRQFPSSWETAETEGQGCPESQRSVSRHWPWRPCVCTIEPAVKSWLIADYLSFPWTFRNTLHSKPLSVCTLCVCASFT